MNKYEKSIVMLKEVNEAHLFTKNVITDLEILVERATPKKPFISHLNGYKTAHCPNCDNLVGENECCSNNDCRQALDWSE